jgi:DNA-binding response OmpR family regulator
MPRILLIDDDPSLLDALTLAFEDAGHEVLTAGDGIRGLAAVSTGHPDMIISDVNMPGVDGFTLCRKLRSTGSRLPIILLTARDNEIDEALGLELGADDYVSKPFSTRVLVARVAALLRRESLRENASSQETAIRTGELELTTDRLLVRYHGAEVQVTVTEFRFLELLTKRPGVVFSRDRILESLRGDTVVDGRIIDTYVRRLRRKFEQIDPTFDSIETVVGAGYRWRTT